MISRPAMNSFPVAMMNMQGSKSNAVCQEDGPSYTLAAMHGHDVHVVAYEAGGAQIARRMTPAECESLQGFPTGRTLVPYRGSHEPADAPRNRAIGNSMAVNCMSWIGDRIACVEG